MPRVMAPAVMAETASPTSAGPGIAKASVDAVVTPEPGRHGAADQPDDDGAAAVALERHAIEIAELLHHPQIDRGDAGDGDDRQRQQTAQPRIVAVAVDDFARHRPPLRRELLRSRRGRGRCVVGDRRRRYPQRRLRLDRIVRQSRLPCGQGRLVER